MLQKFFFRIESGLGFKLVLTRRWHSFLRLHNGLDGGRWFSGLPPRDDARSACFAEHLHRLSRIIISRTCLIATQARVSYHSSFLLDQVPIIILVVTVDVHVTGNGWRIDYFDLGTHDTGALGVLEAQGCSALIAFLQHYGRGHFVLARTWHHSSFY